MGPSQADLFQQALERSLEIREQVGMDFKSPLNAYDLCEEIGVSVRFVNDISMEGLYINSGLRKPTIVISTQRPQSRRAFNCGHELGHHVFGHGSTVDELRDEVRSTSKEPKELAADNFAGHLLMPKLGVSRAFVTRKWDPNLATPNEIFTISCSFGVGYTTLVHHMGSSLHMIRRQRALELLKIGLPRIRESFLGRKTNRPLYVADEHYLMATIDIEVGTLLLLPPNPIAESNSVCPVVSLTDRNLFEALTPGICRVADRVSNWAVMVRVSRQDYHGLAKFRHLEVIIDKG